MTAKKREKMIVRGAILRRAMLFLSLLLVTAVVGQAEGAMQRLGSISGLNLPTRVAVDGAGNIYVTEPMKNVVSVFGRDGALMKTISGMNSPLGIAVGGDGRIYVGNENRKGSKYGPSKASVDVYTASGQYMFSLGKGQGEFAKPNSIAVQNGGTIYVADSDAHMIKMYNPDGSFQGSFGVWGSVNGSQNGEFNFPAGMAIDEAAGEIYVSDLGIFLDPTNGATSGARVQVFDLSGVFKRSFGSYGAGDGFLTRPLGVAVRDGRVYVTDTYQCIAEVFDNAGTFIETMYDAVEMAAPIGIATGADGRVFIASSGTKTIEIYGTDSYTYLTVSPRELSFRAQPGASAATQDITIGNSGVGTLDWNMTADAAWITLGQSSGSAAGSGSAAVAVGASAAGMSQGTYTGTITVRAAGAEEKITVTLEVVSPAVLSVAPAGLAFTGQAGGPQPSGQSISIGISNDPAGTASWTATADTGWISISPAGGASAAVTTATVSVSNAGLGAGVYSGTITVASAGAVGSPATVNVSLELTAAGTISVNTNIDAASFGISGAASYSGSGKHWSVSNAPAGSYTITFNKVSGFATPAAQSFTVTSGRETALSADYRDLRATKKVIAGLGSGAANPASVKVLNTDGTPAGASFTAFSLKYGANVAAGDIDGDGIDEIIAGAGSSPTNPAMVKIFRADGTAVPNMEFIAFAKSFGVNVAAGDIDGDGSDEIIVGTKTGKGVPAQVRVFKAVNGVIVDTGINFITDTTASGVPVAAGDLDGDGIAEIITGTVLDTFGVGLDSVVRTWSANVSGGMGKWTVKALVSFKPYGRGKGAIVAAGDVNGDGKDEIIVSEAVLSRPKIRAYRGDGTFAGVEIVESSLQGTLSLASGDTDNDGLAEIVAGSGSGSAAVRVYSGTGVLKKSFSAFSQYGGVNVGLGKVQ